MAQKNLQPYSKSLLIEKSPIFYGWVIVAIGILGMWMTSPGQTYVFSVFIDWFIRDLHLSRTVVSSLYMAGTFCGSMTLPFTGRLLDRYGSRRTLIAISAALGLACVYMSQIQGMIMLFIGVFFLRALGQGAMQMTSKNVIAQWFIQGRGKAMGVAGLVASGAVAIFPILIHHLIGGYGWRTAYVLLALIVWGTILPLGAAFVRDKPEEYGLLPDGRTESKDERDKEAQAPPLEENWRLKDAIRTPSYWLLAGGIIAHSSLLTALLFHQVSIFESSGLAAELAAVIYAPLAMSGAIATLISGFLLDRVRVGYVLCLTMLMMAMATFLMRVMATPTQGLIYALVLGATMGMFGAISSVAMPKFFGRKYLGEITGFTGMIGSGASAFGPLPFGVGFDYFGGYSEVLSIAVVIPLVVAIAALYMHPPEKRKRRSRQEHASNG